MQKNFKKIIAFRFLSEAEINELVGLLTEIHVKSGDVVVQEFSKSPEIYFIDQGSFNVVVTTKQNNSAFVSVLGEGDCFSESGIFPEMPRSASIVAADDGILYRLHRKDLLQFISRHASGGVKLLMMIIYSLLRKLRMVNRELAYERAEDSAQDDIDHLVRDFMNSI